MGAVFRFADEAGIVDEHCGLPGQCPKQVRVFFIERSFIEFAGDLHDAHTVAADDERHDERGGHTD